MTTISENRVEVDGLDLFYREAGSDNGGMPVLLLHGWPTSSFLYRNVMPHVAETNRVIAVDLPGFGQSSKPLDASYSFRFYERVVEGFLAALDIDELGLTVHDLGGPVGLYWASQQAAGRVRRLAMLNTIVYPEMSFTEKAFLVTVKVPGLRAPFVTQWGLKKAMQVGVADKKRLTDDAIEGVQAPFRDRSSRKALLKSISNLAPGGLKTIAEWVATLEIPVRVIYGAKDKILPRMALTAERVSADVPHAEVTVLDDCGHFLQEERPDEIGALLAAFFGE